MYLSYEDYKTMGGTLDETAFNDFEYEAECIINWYTFNRLLKETEIPEQVVRCTYALIKLAKLKADAMMLGSQTTTTEDAEGHVVSTTTTSSAIASQSNDGVSISYNTVSASNIFDSLSPFKQGGEIESTVRIYLNGVMNSLGKKLLYRGIYPDE